MKNTASDKRQSWPLCDTLPPITAILFLWRHKRGIPLSPTTWPKKHVILPTLFKRSYFSHPLPLNHGYQTESTFVGNGTRIATLWKQIFICQLDLDIQSIKWCQVVPCCRKFLHKRCFRKARETSFQCGHCRVAGKDQDSNREWTEGQWNVGRFRWQPRLGHTSRITRTHPHWTGQKRHCRCEKQCLCSLPSSTRDKFLATSSLSHWSHDLVFVLGQHGLVHLHHPRRTTPSLHSRNSVHTCGSCAVCAKSHLPTDLSIIPCHSVHV